MLKVFLVEDETLIREGLRDIIPWQQYGYTFVGDAGDGEQALPLIREQRPDVLITDIRMPFMDGLALAGLVSREFPNTKIIIISGYDDFEYARQAIRIGVEQYLLKPITKAMLIRTLTEVREKILSEREQENYMEKFRSEMQEYEQFSRRRFFERLVTGRLKVEEIYERADELNISLHAQCYSLVLYSIQEKTVLPQKESESENIGIRVRDAISGFFLLYPEYLMFRWNLTTCAVLVKGDRDQMDALIGRCVQTIRAQAAPFEHQLEWYVAVGGAVERLSGLYTCFNEVSHTFSFRHLVSDSHILTAENTKGLLTGEDASSLKNLDMSKIDPSVIQGFLKNGSPEEVSDFVSEYIGGLLEAAGSKLFCQYLMLNVRFTTIAYLESLGLKQESFVEQLPDMQAVGRAATVEELKEYIGGMLQAALQIREQVSASEGHTVIRQAVEYIDAHYAEDGLSLKEVAACVKVSANYFSAVFSQEMRQTFVEYLTKKRIERAKELLRQTDLRSAEIAAEVGYKDPHYFSFVFRKTQGCTPRDYRTGSRKN